MSGVDRGRFPDAFPRPTRWESTETTMNKEQRERYLEFWDAGDQYDEQLAAEWEAIDNPTRPLDQDLLPRDA